MATTVLTPGDRTQLEDKIKGLQDRVVALEEAITVLRGGTATEEASGGV